MRRWAVVLSMIAASGCEDPNASSPSTSSSAAANPVGGVASAVASASASAKPPPEPKHPYEGTWRGTYEATKGEVTVDEGVPYSAWKKEKGEAFTGRGKLELTVTADSDLTGKATGALGELGVVGRLGEDGELAASVRPTDPNAEGAMTGTLLASNENGRLVGELRVASRSGDVVRKAAVSLEKQPATEPEDRP